jgi:DNA-binding GntR family transcriptional regulator
MNTGFFSRSAGEHIRLIEHMKRKDLCAAQNLLKKHILLKDEYIESVIGN